MISATAREVLRHALHVSSLDRLLMRRRAARGQDTTHLRLGDRREIFRHVYREGVWRNGSDSGSLSGIGSDLTATRSVRERLPIVLREIGAASVLDLGCGDFTWMQQVDLSAINYIGADIVPSVVADNVVKFGSEKRRFLCLDAVVDDLPLAHTVLCREVLFHLSFADGLDVLKRIAGSGAKYAILTSDSALAFNANIRTGDFRRINLRLRPYKLPPPRFTLADEGVVSGRVLGVWPTSALPSFASR